MKQSYDPAAIFEEQLKKCGVDYFDFYLLHNVYEGSTAHLSGRALGHHSLFSEAKAIWGAFAIWAFPATGMWKCFGDFLDAYGDKMEFCQIQLNYLDWTLQDAKAKYELLAERGIPVWVMEPVRGGRLARLSERGRGGAACASSRRKPCGVGLPLPARPARRRHGAQRYVHHGADAGEHRHVLRPCAPFQNRSVTRC